MSRLLVIEPEPMLRYGLAAALTPDHLIHFIASPVEVPDLKDIDAVIVDAATLRQAGAAVDVKAIDAWQLPTVWLDDSESATASKRRDWVALTLPVLREQLLKALFECLNPPSGVAPAAQKAEPAAAPKPRPKKAKPADEPAADNADVIELIELVEVVDDEPDNG